MVLTFLQVVEVQVYLEEHLCKNKHCQMMFPLAGRPYGFYHGNQCESQNKVIGYYFEKSQNEIYLEYYLREVKEQMAYLTGSNV